MLWNLKLFVGRHHFGYCDRHHRAHTGHGRLGEPGISVNPGMAQEKRDQHLSVSQYQTKSETQFGVSDSLSTVQNPLSNLKCALSTVHFLLSTVHYLIHCLRFTLHSVLFTVHLFNTNFSLIYVSYEYGTLRVCIRYIANPKNKVQKDIAHWDFNRRRTAGTAQIKRKLLTGFIDITIINIQGKTHTIYKFGSHYRTL